MYVQIIKIKLIIAQILKHKKQKHTAVCSKKL